MDGDADALEEFVLVGRREGDRPGEADMEGEVGAEVAGEEAVQLDLRAYIRLDLLQEPGEYIMLRRRRKP